MGPTYWGNSNKSKSTAFNREFPYDNAYRNTRPPRKVAWLYLARKFTMNDDTCPIEKWWLSGVMLVFRRVAVAVFFQMGSCGMLFQGPAFDKFRILKSRKMLGIYSLQDLKTACHGIIRRLMEVGENIPQVLGKQPVTHPNSWLKQGNLYADILCVCGQQPW